MAGAYDVAASVGRLGEFRDTIGVDLEGVISDGWSRPVPRAPEIPFPENFYSYRYSLIDQAHIDALRTGRTRDGLLGDRRCRARPGVRGSELGQLARAHR
jgi:hypothetical protein